MPDEIRRQLKERLDWLDAVIDELLRMKAGLNARCIECGRPWLDPAERWRSYLDDDDTAQLFCPRLCGVRRVGRFVAR